jgi:hypothetical protein
MRDKVNILIKSDINTILKDKELSLLLLKTYSVLYLSGKQPNFCEKCMHGYYIKIVNNGIKQIEFMESKTCKLKPGVFFVAKQGMHYSDANVNDEKAIQLLNLGYLKETHFETLPKNYLVKASGVDLNVINKGLFTSENLEIYKGNVLMDFVKKELGVKNINSKKSAIAKILDWQKV